MAIGALAAAGWTLDDVLDLTMPQISVVTEMLARHKAYMAELIVEPIAGMFGAKRKPGRVTSRTPRKSPTVKGRSDQKAREQKEAYRLMQMANLGFKVRDT